LLDLARIEDALATQPLNHILFERFAQDTLSEWYPGLVPIPGGTDWGTDADISGTGDVVPPRLIVTSSRTVAGVRANMRRSINSMKAHGRPLERIVLANPASLNLQQRQKLIELARKNGAVLDTNDIYGLEYFASKLRRDGYWRKELLGLPSEPISLSRLSPELAESLLAHLPLVGHEEELAELGAALAAGDDLIVIGPPGVGKSRVVAELHGVVFVDRDAPLSRVAEDLRWHRPGVIVVDDAGGSEVLIRQLIDMSERSRICTTTALSRSAGRTRRSASKPGCPATRRLL
jgi:hypothetical protein